MKLILAKNKQNIFFVVGFLLLFVVYYYALGLGSYFDDNALLFSNQFIKDSLNPLKYWFRGNMDTKAWPLTHTIYWLCFHLFHTNHFPYRVLTLALHWLNGIVLFSILKKRVRLSSAMWITSLFWFHPVAVECVTWIVQIGTLVTTLFFAWWLVLLEEGAKPKKNFFALLGMFTTKGYAFFLPLLSTLKRRETVGAKSLLEAIPVLLLAAYAAFLVSVGVYSYSGEKLMSYQYLGLKEEASAPVAAPTTTQKNETSAAVKKVEKKKKSKLKKQTKNEAKIKILEQPREKILGQPGLAIPATSMSYANDQLYRGSALLYWYKKISACGRSSTYYLARVITYSDLPTGKMEFHPNWDPLFFILGLGVFSLLGFCVYRKWWIWAAGILTYLPVSGIFYVPYMKFGLVADRVIYVPLFAFAFGLGLLYDRIDHVWLRRVSWIFPVLFMITAYFVVHVDRADFPIY